MKNVLVTGISGFVGKVTARKLLENPENKIYGLIRPNTKTARIAEFKDRVEFIKVDLCQIDKLKITLSNYTFDAIVHIGALRGGRPDTRDKYYLANVEATQVIADYCVETKAELLYCSSVGVFGAIPESLPAKDDTPKKDDNYYHFTKIKSEAIITDLSNKKGLKSVIIRPAITYGAGDYGFPYTLCKLVDKGLMILTFSPIKIHLTNVNTLAQTFSFFLENDFITGQKYIIADPHPVLLEDLVNVISKSLHQKEYPKWKKIPNFIFSLAIKIARFLKNEVFVSRFELISQSWYYQVDDSYSHIPLTKKDTLQDIESVINWYKEKN